MKLIKPEVVDITQTDYTLEGVYKQIELAGRTCYKSEDRITEDSAKPFVDMLIERGHTAMLEHGTVYLKFQDMIRGFSEFREYSTMNPWNVWINYGDFAYVTTNFRAILEKGLMEQVKNGGLQYDPKVHVPRLSFRIICSIGVARELCRHRVFSFAQESTRYCNYTKEKFGGITFIEPYWYNDARPVMQSYFRNLLDDASETYFTMIENGFSAQQAREVLPLATKTEIVMTGTLPQWRDFLALRTDVAAHPDMRIIANKIKDLINGKEKG